MRLSIIVIALAVALAGCASIREAQMALPAALAGATPESIDGIGIGRTGSFRVGAESGSFKRSRDRLELFEAVGFDRANTRLNLTRADGSAAQAACRGRQTTATVGILNTAPKPFTFECEWTGALTGQMTVAAPSWIPGTRAERSGRLTTGATTLEIRSVHNVDGSPLPLEAPIGYTFTHAGKVVGAVELNGTTPRLWRPATDSALREPVTMAALALALLWDPAGAAP